MGLWDLLHEDNVIIPPCLEAEMHVKLSKEFEMKTSLTELTS